MVRWELVSFGLRLNMVIGGNSGRLEDKLIEGKLEDGKNDSVMEMARHGWG